MFVLSEIYQACEPYPVKFFKPWWDLLIDYVIMGLLLIALLTFTRVIFENDLGVTSIGVNQTLPYWEARYVSAQCAHIFEGRYLVFYPYLLFVEWILLSIIHHGWFIFPAISSKMEHFHKIFHQMFQTQPKFYRNPNTLKMPNELKYDGENREKIEILHNRFLYLLTSESFLTKVYQAKTYSLFLFSFFSTIMVIITPFRSLRSFSSNFPCVLPNNTPLAFDFRNISCHFEPSFFIYGAIVGNCFITVTITIISLNGVIWTLRFIWLHRDHDITETISDYYGGLPGFEDFRFCIMLIEVNIRDGNVMFETIKNCIISQAKRFREFNYARRDKLDESALIITQTHLLKDSKNCVRWITEQLGYRELGNSQNSNHLFDIIHDLQDSMGYIDFNVRLSMREKLLAEIEQNPQIFKTLIDKDKDEKSYEEFVSNLHSESSYGNQYCLMAAAQLLNIQIVLIQCHINKKVQEVFIPYGKFKGKVFATKFLTFISPHYYHMTEDLPVSPDWPSIVTKRRMYACDVSFRANMRNVAVRCISTATELQGKRKLNRYSRSQADVGATAMDMPVMGLKRKL